jgi:hypothetical protein
MLNFSVKKGIIHSHRDLNSVSSSTNKTTLLGPIPSRLRSPAPRVRKPPRAAASSAGGSTSLSLKPVVCNSLELISIATGARDVSTSGVHSWNMSPDASSSTLFSHRLMTRAVFIVEARDPIILPLAMVEIQLFHRTCAITSITKLTQSVMPRPYEYILFSGPLRPSLHTTPHTGLRQGQGLDNPLCYPLLPMYYTLTQQHGELIFLPGSDLRAHRHIQQVTT